MEKTRPPSSRDAFPLPSLSFLLPFVLLDTFYYFFCEALSLCHPAAVSCTRCRGEHTDCRL